MILPYAREDAMNDIAAARSHVADALFALEHAPPWPDRDELLAALARAAAILAAGTVLAQTPVQRKRRSVA